MQQHQWAGEGHRPTASRIAICLLLALGCSVAAADPPDASGAQPTIPPQGVLPPDVPAKTAPAPSENWLTRWFDPSKAPFIPVPLIGSDPNSGTTLGILPVWLKSNDDHEISQIIAPDVLHNPYFGWGADARIYSYSSSDEQWSVDTGFNQKVQRDFEALYQDGRLRDQRWSTNYSLIYDRSGTPRFFGVGNESLAISETNYTNSEGLAQVQVGLNLSHEWQILYTGRLIYDDVTPGTLAGIDSIETRFGRILGVGTNNQILNRLSVVYDTRDDLVVPMHGMEWVAYGGGAARHGFLNDSMYSEAGLDGRDFWTVSEGTVIATHMAIRYLPSSHEVPFWALSSIGGGSSAVGGEQPLRGYGEGRFYDRNSFSTSLELRRTVFSFDAVTTRVDVEMAPFVDMGRVFSRTNTDPFEQLHHVFGVGFRGIARPFVVGKVDIGYGNEGVAVFTGLNYPF